jgi:hypothetical protein
MFYVVVVKASYWLFVFWLLNANTTLETLTPTQIFGGLLIRLTCYPGVLTSNWQPPGNKSLKAGLQSTNSNIAATVVIWKKYSIFSCYGLWDLSVIIN